MDKDTINNYGWIVFCVMGLAIVIALAAPIGNFVGDNMWNTTDVLLDTSEDISGDIDISAETETTTQENELDISPESGKLIVAGKKMAVIGDSISEGVSSVILESGSVTPATSGENRLTNTNKAWWQQVKTRYGIGDVVNNSFAGACFSKDGSTTNYRFTYYLNDTYLPDDLDIIIFFGGTNDYGRNSRLGKITDAPSTSNNATFCASVKATLEYLTTNFPNAEIIYFTPLPRWEQTGMVLTDENGNRYIEGGEKYNEVNGRKLLLEDYANAIKSLCAMYQVPVCDLLSNSGMNMSDFEFKMQYAPDGLHPNLEGTNLYVNNAIFPFLDEIWEKVNG